MPESNPDDLLLLIRCPSCGQRFKVGEDLRSRTVECGSCEHRFRINDEVIVRGKKFYPGERRDVSLNRFQRVPLAIGNPNPAVQTVRYAEPPKAANFEPTPPLRILAAAVGFIIIAFMALLFILGTQRGGALDGMTTENRLLMAGFASLLATALILYGNPKTRFRAGLIAVLMSAALVALAFVFTQGATPLQVSGTAAKGTPPAARPEAPVADPNAALREQIGTRPLEDEIEKLKAAGSTKTAVGLWLRDLRETNRILVRDYIMRTLKADPSTHPYPRGNGDYLMVVTGINASLAEVAAVVDPLGSEILSHPGISVVEVKVDNSRFVEGPIEKLNDRNDPAFYDLNKRELESIDLQRVSKAVKRLADAEPSVYRSDITRKLITLLAADGVDFKGDVARALTVWSETPGPAGEAALAVLGEKVKRGGAVPPDLVALIVKERNPGVIPLIGELWRRNPTQWESLYAEVGNPAEQAVIRFLPQTDGALRQSAVRLLGKIGGSNSLPVLEAADVTGDAELKVLIEKSVQAIRSRMEE
jgi:hypothetical protein